VGVTVADGRFMKPLDKDMIRQLAETHDVIVTAEEVGRMAVLWASVCTNIDLFCLLPCLMIQQLTESRDINITVEVVWKIVLCGHRCVYI